jgi:hypothetical protein
MAQVFKINGTTLARIVKADWLEAILAESLAGGTILGRWKGHAWQTEAMAAAEYDTLFALQGRRVSLTTTNYSNLNGDYKTYFEAVLLNIEAAHPGPIRQGVRVEFQVRT